MPIRGGASVFDGITQDDLVVAFYPCIYFTGSTNPCYYTLENINYRGLTLKEKVEKIIERSNNRQKFYRILLKLVGVCLIKKIRIVVENPYSATSYLHNNFYKSPSVYDKNRMERGDYFVKPTGYWFFNCEPTQGFTHQNNKEQKRVWDCRSAPKAGLCSEERSLISPDYARNWICDFIIGKPQPEIDLSLFY